MLRCLAWSRDFNRAERAKHPDTWMAHDYCPLFCGEFENTREDILLAAREAAALGEIDLSVPRESFEIFMARLEGPPVQITDKGYDWIRARDAIGEAEQERAAPQGETE